MARKNLFPQHKRIKPKPNMKNKPKGIKDPDYLSWLHSQDLPCFCCGDRGCIELHHIKDGSTDIKNDHEVIALCGEKCHRLGHELSVHGTPKKFREAFPLRVQRLEALKLYMSYKETAEALLADEDMIKHLDNGRG